MWLAAGRRFGFILGVLASLTVLGSLLLAFLAGWSLNRSIATGFDLVGIFLMVIGFFVGNRGPARLKNHSAPFWGPRFLRWATPGEHVEAINDSAVFIVIGLVLIVIGITIDNRYQLV
jgi:hypothetical protein